MADGAPAFVPRAERIFHGLVAAALAAVYAVSVVPVDVRDLPPTFGVRDTGFSTCMLRRMTGLPCPTCGMTRSFRAMGQADVAAAAAFHPLGPVLYAVFLVVMVRSAGIAIRGRAWLGRTARVLVWSIPVLALALLVVYGVRVALFVADGTARAAWRASALGAMVR